MTTYNYRLGAQAPREPITITHECEACGVPLMYEAELSGWLGHPLWVDASRVARTFGAHQLCPVTGADHLPKVSAT